MIVRRHRCGPPVGAVAAYVRSKWFVSVARVLSTRGNKLGAARQLVRRGRQALATVGLEQRVVWIFASPRSGTTWLVNLLGQLTDGAVVDEPLIGAHLGVQIESVSGLARPDDPTIIESQRSRRDYVLSRRSAEVWVPAIRSLFLGHCALAAAAAPTRGRGRAPLVLVKEPNGTIAAPVLSRLFPRSRILLVLRDGRDVVDSTLAGASGGWITESFGIELQEHERRAFLERRAQQWVSTVRAAQVAYEAHPVALRHRVTYEALRGATEAEVGSILDWLGVEVSPSRLAATVEKLSFENLPADRKGQAHFARAASPGLWRERFDAGEQAVLYRVMGDTLSDLGYAP